MTGIIVAIVVTVLIIIGSIAGFAMPEEASSNENVKEETRTNEEIKRLSKNEAVISNRMNSFAIAGFVLGIISLSSGWIFLGIPPILAMLFSGTALDQIKETGENGQGLAFAGVTLGVMGFALTLVFLVIFLISSEK